MALTQTFTKHAKTTQLAVQVTLKRRIRSATARHRDGAIWVTVPSHWSKKLQQEAIDTLVGRLRDQNQANCTLAFESRQSDRCLTFDNAADLAWWIHDLNQATLKAPISGIRVGTAKFTRLACMNVRTRLMTISRFSLIDVPEAALRYLVLHELAHCFVANHSKAFWAQVARFCPDYRHQARVMQAVHHVNVADIPDAALPGGLMMSRLVLFGPEGPQVKALKPIKTSAVAPMAPSYTSTAPKRRAAAAAKDKDTVQLSLFEA